ncbi:MAG: carboxypeptidase regulatory-like domain-containing protein [Candidatus Eisenbacteria bacterium]|nr:carboxypeptidase regulatory-like domain-containing protein [Candidatus Eisenbacteria bacterium]
MKHLSALQLSSSLDGTLTGVELEAVVQHLGACRECRDRHSAFSKQNDALRRLLAFEPSERQLAESLALVESALHAAVREDSAPAAAHTAPPRPTPAPSASPTAPVAPLPPVRQPPVLAGTRAPRRVHPAFAMAGTAGAIALLLAAAFALRKPASPSAPSAPVAARATASAPVKPRPAPPVTLPAQTPATVRLASTTRTAPQVVRPAAPRTVTPARTAPAPTPVLVARPQPPVVPTTTLVTRTITSTAPAAPAPTPSSPPAESARTDEGAAWPLLCGVVTDATGAPVAGARVSLADLDLSARTDRRGRFCVAAPPGERTLSVLAQGFASARRLVALGAAGMELQITLADRE